MLLEAAANSRALHLLGAAKQVQAFQLKLLF